MPHQAPKTKAAIRVRDATLVIVRARGTVIHTAPNFRAVEAWAGPMQILHRTPFQKLPPLSEQMMRDLALLEEMTGKSANLNLDYGLDVWHGRKVLNIKWIADDRRVDVVSFKRGPWEEELMSFAESLLPATRPLP